MNTRFYQDNNGNQFPDYEYACRVYGADTPSDLAAEWQWLNQRQTDMMMDEMECNIIQPGAFLDIEIEIPF